MKLETIKRFSMARFDNTQPFSMKGINLKDSRWISCVSLEFKELYVHSPEIAICEELGYGTIHIEEHEDGKHRFYESEKLVKTEIIIREISSFW